jgi:fluoride exporter
VTVLLVAVGAALGAPARYLLGHFFDRGPIPWGTTSANLVGSLLAGFFAALSLSGSLVALLLTGFCGGLTTYSAFVVQSHDRGPRRGGLTMLLTVVGALLLCALGFQVGAQA